MTRREILISSVFSTAAFKAAGAGTGDLRRRGDLVQFPDPTTENPILRLTSPANTSFLPDTSHRFISPEGKFLVFTSERKGVFAPYRLDFKTGLAHILFEPEKLHPRSFCLGASGRTLLYLDGGVLKEFTFGSRHIRTVAEGIESFSVGRNGTDLVWVREGKLENEAGEKIAGDVGGPCFLSPDRLSCAFTRPGAQGQSSIWAVPMRASAGDAEAKLLVEGNVSEPFWSPDDPSLLFLRRESQDGIERSFIREVTVPQASEQNVSPTPAFASFAPNGDASVFVGASRSKAQPHIVLLLRTPRRELTLCEHHCSDARAVSPVFSPDSRRVFFQTDREGKFAIYSVNTEQFVEAT